jgi:hypothetical protein
MIPSPIQNYKFYGWVRLLVVLILVFFSNISFSQTDSITKLNRRENIVGLSLSGGYIVSMLGLYQLWYADYPQSKFHFFNDNKEWMHMDKVGHMFSSYTIGKYSTDMMKWAGYSPQKASIAGPLYAYLYLSTIEVFDGFSSGWGFSGGDMLANTIGTGLVMGQSLAWNEQRITMKFSFSPTPFAKKRPEVLGKNLVENLFKDYNGQTYWLCVNPKSFAPKSKWPDWLDISLGYGATGMYGGDNNFWYAGNIWQPIDYSSTPRRMEFYLSPDINLEKLKVKKKWLKYSLKVLNTFKFPLPTLNYTQGVGFKVEPLKF